MSTGIGIVNTSGLQQNNIFVLDDPTSASSTNGTGSTSGGLQSFLNQLQSLMGSDASTPSTTFVGAGLPVSTPAQSVDSNNDVAGNDSTQAQPRRVGGHHHGHHHHMQASTTSNASGSTSASNLQSDVGKLVNDMFSMLQQTGPSAVTSSASSTAPATVASAVTSSATAVSSSTSSSASNPVSTPSDVNTAASSLQNDANQLVSNLFSMLQQLESGAGTASASVGSSSTQTTTDPTQSAQSIAASDPTNLSTSSVTSPTPVQNTSLANLENMVAQDFVNAIQAYGSVNSLPSIQSTATTA